MVFLFFCLPFGSLLLFNAENESDNRLRYSHPQKIPPRSPPMQENHAETPGSKKRPLDEENAPRKNAKPDDILHKSCYACLEIPICSAENCPDCQDAGYTLVQCYRMSGYLKPKTQCQNYGCADPSCMISCEDCEKWFCRPCFDVIGTECQNQDCGLELCHHCSRQCGKCRDCFCLQDSEKCLVACDLCDEYYCLEDAKSMLVGAGCKECVQETEQM